MRFRGGGVGHHSLRSTTNQFLSDRHKSDLEAAREDQDSRDLDEFEEPIEDQTVEVTQEESEGENEVEDGGSGDLEDGGGSGDSEDSQAERESEDDDDSSGDLEYDAL